MEITGSREGNMKKRNLAEVLWRLRFQTWDKLAADISCRGVWEGDQRLPNGWSRPYGYDATGVLINWEFDKRG
jgi:hypothetical protein